MREMLPKTLTVSQFIEVLNRSLEQFYAVMVEGEISQSNRYASGHWYFSIKDERAVIRCVMWRSNLSSLRESFRVGDKVRLTGKPNVYEGNGGLTFICTKIERAGEGKLYELFLKLKGELAALGWFDQSLKKPIPKVPHVVGIVTSQGGAALRDVLHRLSERAPYALPIVYHTPVQGEGSADQIAEALRRANREGRAEVLLLVRGGGSLEDLWSFNERVVAQAIHESVIPVISGIGHETDFTIADMVADFRAPTPTGAAEAAAERQEVLEERVCSLWTALERAFENAMDRNRMDLSFYSAVFDSGERLLRPFRLHLTAASHFSSPELETLGARVNAGFSRLQDNCTQSLNAAEAEVKFAGRYFLSPGTLLESFYTRVKAASVRSRPDFEGLELKIQGISNTLKSTEKFLLRYKAEGFQISVNELCGSIKNTLTRAQLRFTVLSPMLVYSFDSQMKRCRQLRETLAQGILRVLETEQNQFHRQSVWLKLGRPKPNEEPVNAACSAMQSAMTRAVQMNSLRLRSLEQVWFFLDPKRSGAPGSGFVFLNGVPVTSIKQLRSGDFVEVLLKDGSFDARVGTVKQDS